jgi:hypothetical protein
MLFLIDLWCRLLFILCCIIANNAARCAFILGILYLAFEVFPIIFIGKHNFNMQMTGVTFLGIALGNLIGLATTPYWNR